MNECVLPLKRLEISLSKIISHQIIMLVIWKFFRVKNIKHIIHAFIHLIFFDFSFTSWSIFIVQCKKQKWKRLIFYIFGKKCIHYVELHTHTHFFRYIWIHSLVFRTSHRTKLNEYDFDEMRKSIIPIPFVFVFFFFSEGQTNKHRFWDFQNSFFYVFKCRYGGRNIYRRIWSESSTASIQYKRKSIKTLLFCRSIKLEQ